jgi:hypothetical protein
MLLSIQMSSVVSNCLLIVVTSGAAQLEALLWSTLPGIDPTDVEKTLLTLTFYLAVFYSVPLVECAPNSGGGNSDSLAPGEDDARHATMMFKDWAISFMSKFIEGIKKTMGGLIIFACIVNLFFGFFSLSLGASGEALEEWLR